MSIGSWQATVEATATVVAALGTVAAVVVALFLQPWRERKLAPRLSIQQGANSSGHGFGPTVAPPLIVMSIRIAAERRRRAAENVEILLTAWWSGRDGKPNTVIDHVPLQWVGSRKEGTEVTQIRLSPGTEREVALLWLGRPRQLRALSGGDVDDGDPRVNALAFAVRADDDRLELLTDALAYGIRIDATASNADTVSYAIGLRTHQVWNGKPLDRKSGKAPPATIGDADDPRLDIYLEWQRLTRDQLQDPSQANRGWISAERPQDLRRVPDDEE